MKIKTAELTGPALDWAVAKCEEGWILETNSFISHHQLGRMNFSTKWELGGPIIERGIVSIDKEEGGKRWVAFAWRTDRDLQKSIGPTPMIAAMRCYVASRLGEEVEIPKELTT